MVKKETMEVTFGFLMIFACAMVLVGLLFGVMIYTTGGDESVNTDFLDGLCKEIFGEEYVWVDEFGIEDSLRCKFVEVVEYTIEEEVEPECEYPKEGDYHVHQKQDEKQGCGSTGSYEYR